MADKIVLPFNVEAERTVLGSMLLTSSAASIALSSLSEESFYDSRNQIVFRAMKALADSFTAIDVNTLHNELKLMKEDKEVNSPDYIIELIDGVINPNNVDHYVNIVRDQAVLRNFLIRIEKAKKDYAEGEIENVADYLTFTMNELDKIASSRSVGNFRTAKEVSESVRNKIKLESNRENKKLTGVDTGYSYLNDITHGWQPETLNVIAARPSVGKTAFALNLAFNAAKHSEKTVAFFSCEMSSESVEQRLASCRSTIPLGKIQTGDLSGKEMAMVNNGLDEIGDLKLFFDDTPNADLGDIVTKSRKLAQQHPDLCAIFIDYLNIISVKSSKYDSRSLEIAQITKTLKELARSLKIPVIVLAQLNRDVDKSDSKVPSMANLKESGSIEQDADVILLLYRKDYYKDLGQTVKPKGPANSEFSRNLEANVQNAKNNGKDENSVSVVNISIAKNRNGKTGEVILLFSKGIQRFDTPKLEQMQNLSGSQNDNSISINPGE